MGVSLASFTITVVMDSRTFIVGIHCYVFVVLRHVDELPMTWGRHVEIVNFAIFAHFPCSELCGKSIGTVGIDHAGFIISYEELCMPLL